MKHRPLRRPIEEAALRRAARTRPEGLPTHVLKTRLRHAHTLHDRHGAQLLHHQLARTTT